MRFLPTARSVSGVILVGALTLGAGEGTQNSQNSKAPAGSLPAAVPAGKDGAPMVPIPEGPFVMGNNEGSGNERPEHKVFLNSYLIDQFEVTISRYAKFLADAKHPAPPT